MSVNATDCAPFLSTTLFQLSRGSKHSAEDVAGAIEQIISTSNSSASSKPATVKRTVKTSAEQVSTSAGVDGAWLRYEEERSPSWYAESGLTDLRNHIVVVCIRKKIVSLTFSDQSARNITVQAIKAGKADVLKDLSLVPPQAMETAFVDGRVRTLWLSGAHRRSLIKPDAKVLAGLDLASALDPLEDQSFYFSSVRSTSSQTALKKNNKESVIGVSPQQARVWIGPTDNWTDFNKRTRAILELAYQGLNAKGQYNPVLPILAEQTSDLSGVFAPYDAAVIVPELMLSAAVENDGEDRWMQEFADAASFVVRPDKKKNNVFEADVLWGDDALGTLECELSNAKAGGVELSIKKKTWNEKMEHHSELYKICRNPENLTVYFDTGHTFARGNLYKTRFRDARFDGWKWVKFSDFDIEVKDEKPLEGKRFAVEWMGELRDNSLFGFVVRQWGGVSNPSGGAYGWLVCDDGAMESADFIHLDDSNDNAHLTLIHIKGSHSKSLNRGISVADYEVVVGQAVKNVRYLDRELAAQKLEKPGQEKLENAVWHNGKRQDNREEFIKRLKDIGSNIKKTVVVMQPRVRMTSHDAVSTKISNGKTTDSAVLRMRQLDALLLAARADCRGLGVEFFVIGEDDT